MNFVSLLVFAALMVLRYRAMMKYREELYPPWFYGVSAVIIVIGLYWALDMWSRENIVSAMMVAAITVADLIFVVFIMLVEWNMTTKRKN